MWLYKMDNTYLKKPEDYEHIIRHIISQVAEYI